MGNPVVLVAADAFGLPNAEKPLVNRDAAADDLAAVMKNEMRRCFFNVFSKSAQLFGACGGENDDVSLLLKSC